METAAAAARVEALIRFIGREVTLYGWLTYKRTSGGIWFLLIRDGSGVVQCVLSRDAVTSGSYRTAAAIPVESSVCVQGRVRRDDRAPGGLEIRVDMLRVMHPANAGIHCGQRQSVRQRMDNRHLDIRSPEAAAVCRVRHTLIAACQQFLHNHGFVFFFPPVLVPAGAADTGRAFQVDFFGRSMDLSRRGLFYLEAGAMSLGRVYSLSPVFFAENKQTGRHLAECWMLEAVAAFVDLNEMLHITEELISDAAGHVARSCREDLILLKRDADRLARIRPPFRKHDTENASDTPVVRAAVRQEPPGFTVKRTSGRDSPLWMEIHVPGEAWRLAYVGQYEDDEDRLRQNMRNSHTEGHAYEWIADLAACGGVVHSGFRLQVEHMTGWLCGLSHIRDAIPFPRMVHRWSP